MPSNALCRLKTIDMVLSALTSDSQEHCNPNHEMIVILRGEYRSKCAGAELIAGPGMAVCYPAGLAHRPIKFCPRHTSLYCLVWEGPWPSSQEPLVVEDMRGRLLQSASWLHEAWLRGPVGAALVEHLFAAFLDEMRQILIHKTPSHNPIRQLAADILEHLQKSHNVEDMVRMAGLERRTFERRFYEIFDCSPGEWLAGIRCDRAKALITTTDLPMADIAQAVGLSNADTLSRLLRRRLGLTLRDLRRQRS
jgi:AraC-like DNA-binding protein